MTVEYLVTTSLLAVQSVHICSDLATSINQNKLTFRHLGKKAMS